MKKYFGTGYVLHDTDSNTYQFVICDSTDEMFIEISKAYCFADCDSTYRISAIFLNEREVTYVGWRPDMYYEFRYMDNNDLAWSGSFRNWEH